MSAKWMGYFFDDTDLEASELLLALAIADHADADGIAYPGVGLLAQKVRLSERQTQRLIKDLEAGGHLKVERKQGRGNLSIFRLQKVKRVTPFPKDKRRHMEHIKGDISSTEKVTFAALPLNKEEPLLEPNKNTQKEGSENGEKDAGKIQFISKPRLKDIVSFGSSNTDRPTADFGRFRDDLESWYCGELNTVTFDPTKATADYVQYLFDNKFTIEEIKEFYKEAKRDKWRSGAVTLGAIVKGIAAWRKKSQENAANNLPTVEEKLRASDETRARMRPAPPREIAIPEVSTK